MQKLTRKLKLRNKLQMRMMQTWQSAQIIFKISKFIKKKEIVGMELHFYRKYSKAIIFTTVLQFFEEKSELNSILANIMMVLL